jgi:protoporphyrinogen oxidase
VLSTIPVPLLARLIRGDDAPPLDSAGTLSHRAMILVYLTLGVDRFTEFDAHYFPELTIRISRLSEPKNYSLTERRGRTVLCAEMPCATSDAEWTMSDEGLGHIVCADLARAGLPAGHQLLDVHVERLPHAYPLYTRGYRQAFEAIDRWIAGFHGLVTFGRQGLFVHDNTHHTIAMAYALVDCLREDGTFDRPAWARARAEFQSHVVED